jgi:hypothetical protein
MMAREVAPGHARFGGGAWGPDRVCAGRVGRSGGRGEKAWSRCDGKVLCAGWGGANKGSRWGGGGGPIGSEGMNGPVGRKWGRTGAPSVGGALLYRRRRRCRAAPSRGRGRRDFCATSSYTCEQNQSSSQHGQHRRGERHSQPSSSRPPTPTTRRSDRAPRSATRPSVLLFAAHAGRLHVARPHRIRPAIANKRRFLPTRRPLRPSRPALSETRGARGASQAGAAGGGAGRQRLGAGVAVAFEATVAASLPAAQRRADQQATSCSKCKGDDEGGAGAGAHGAGGAAGHGDCGGGGAGAERAACGGGRGFGRRAGRGRERGAVAVAARDGAARGASETAAEAAAGAARGGGRGQEGEEERGERGEQATMAARRRRRRRPHVCELFAPRCVMRPRASRGVGESGASARLALDLPPRTGGDERKKKEGCGRSCDSCFSRRKKRVCGGICVA